MDDIDKISWITNDIATGPYAFVQTNVGKNVKVVDVRSMVDKFGNSSVLIVAKIREAISYLEKDQKIIICCDYGISRSNSIAAGVISKHNKISFNKALGTVINATGQKQIKIEVVNEVRKAIDAEVDDRQQSSLSKVYVTGLSGYIGRNFKSRFSAEFEIAGSGKNIDILQGGIELDLAVRNQKSNWLVHMANPRIVNTNQSMGEAVTMMKNVLDVCTANNTSLLFISSLDIFRGHDEVLNNVSLVKKIPSGINGETKLICEQMIDQCKSKYGFKVAIVRAGHIFGNNDLKPNFLHNYMDKAQANNTISVHSYLNGSPVVNLIHVKDLVKILGSIIQNGVYGVFNVAGPEDLTTQQIAEKIIKKTQSKSDIEVHHLNEKISNIMFGEIKADSLYYQPKITVDHYLDEIIDNYANK